MDELSKKIIHLMRGSLSLSDDKRINLDDTLIDDLGADSLDLSELAMNLEEKFEIEISDGDLEEIITVNDVIETVRRLKEEAGD